MCNATLTCSCRHGCNNPVALKGDLCDVCWATWKMADTDECGLPVVVPIEPEWVQQDAAKVDAAIAKVANGIL